MFHLVDNNNSQIRFEDAKLIYETYLLEAPDLIREEELEKTLISLGYNVIQKNETPRLGLKDFLLLKENNYLIARNAGWRTVIYIESFIGSLWNWNITVKGIFKDAKNLEQITSALEIATKEKAKRYASQYGKDYEYLLAAYAIK